MTAIALAALFGVMAAASSHTRVVQFPEELEFYPFGFSALKPSAITPNLRQSYAFAGGGDRVAVDRSERCPEGWRDLESATIVTAYRITDVASRRGGADLFVAGIHADDSDVIEHWSFGTRSGGYFVDPMVAAQPIGTSMGQFHPTEAIQGPNFVCPPESARMPSPERKAIAQRVDLGHVRVMAADPEGRFLLYQAHDTSSIWQIDLTQEPTALAQLLTVASTPHLAFTKTMRLLRHQTAGRRYFLTESSRLGQYPNTNHSITMLVDAENDGVFESVVTMLTATWHDDPLSTGWETFENIGVSLEE